MSHRNPDAGSPIVTRMLSTFHGEEGEVRRMASNSGWLLVDKVLRGGGGLAILVILGRMLGVERYGEYGLALAIIGIFSALAVMGLDGVVVRRLIETEGNSSSVLGTALRLRWIGGILALVGALLTSKLLQTQSATLVGLVALLSGAFLFQSSDVIDYWFQAQLQAGPVVKVRITVFILGSLAKIAALLAGASLLSLGWIVLFEAFAASLGLLWAAWRHGIISRHLWSWSPDEARIQLALAWPLLISGLMVALFFKIDQVLLGWLRGVKDVGIYQSALRLVELWNLLPTIILPSFYPGLIRLYQSDRHAYQRRLEVLFGSFALAAWGILAVNITLSNILVRQLFGVDFAGGGIVLAVLAISLLFHYSAHIRAQVLLVESLTLYHTPIVILSIILMLVMNLLLIPRYGPVGAAIATIVSSCFSGLISSFLFPRLRPIGFMQVRALLGGILWPKSS